MKTFKITPEGQDVVRMRRMGMRTLTNRLDNFESISLLKDGTVVVVTELEELPPLPGFMSVTVLEGPAVTDEAADLAYAIAQAREAESSVTTATVLHPSHADPVEPLEEESEEAYLERVRARVSAPDVGEPLYRQEYPDVAQPAPAPWATRSPDDPAPVVPKSAFSPPVGAPSLGDPAGSAGYLDDREAVVGEGQDAEQAPAHDDGAHGVQEGV